MNSYRIRDIKSTHDLYEEFKQLKKMPIIGSSHVEKSMVFIKRISLLKMNMVLEMMKTNSLRDLVNGGFLSVRQYYYFLNYFKMRGYNENTMIERVYLKPYELNEYYEWVEYNKEYLYNLNYRFLG